MKPIQIVIDTNVLVSAIRSKRGASFELLNCLGDPRWQLNISTTLILEYEMAMKRQYIAQRQNPVLADDIINVLVSVAKKRAIFFRWRPVLPDPKDDFILELAVASEAFGVAALRPSDFLSLLEERQ